MVKIRLRRVAKKGHPQYRLVVADSRSPQGGRFIEIVGTYDAMPNPPTFTLKEDRIKEWLIKGARPTDSARSLLERAGMLPKTEHKQLQRAPKKAKPEAAAPKPAAEAAPAAEVTETKAETVVEAEAPAAKESKAEAEAPAEAAEPPVEEATAEAVESAEPVAEPVAEAPAEPEAETKSEG